MKIENPQMSEGKNILIALTREYLPDILYRT